MLRYVLGFAMGVGKHVQALNPYEVWCQWMQNIQYGWYLEFCGLYAQNEFYFWFQVLNRCKKILNVYGTWVLGFKVVENSGQ